MSDSDVENYKQIKSDLDELRLLVEKSELWVYKKKSSEGGGKEKKGEAKMVMMMMMIIMIMMILLCFLFNFIQDVPSVNDLSGSPIDLNLGPQINDLAVQNYRTIKDILIR